MSIYVYIQQGSFELKMSISLIDITYYMQIYTYVVINDDARV